jgi:hypothetical protein
MGIVEQGMWNDWYKKFGVSKLANLRGTNGPGHCINPRNGEFWQTFQSLAFRAKHLCGCKEHPGSVDREFGGQNLRWQQVAVV